MRNYTKGLLPLSLALVFGASTALAGGDEAKKFTHLDADNSGAIDRQELTGHQKAIDQFDDADVNGNGVLERAEFASLGLDDDDDHHDDHDHDSDSDVDVDVDAD